jgi:hypothetical protein
MLMRHIVYACLSSTSLSDTLSHFHTFTLAHKLNLKKPPSNWRLLASSKEIASIKKASDGDAVLIMLTNGARWSKKLKWEILPM